MVGGIGAAVGAVVAAGAALGACPAVPVGPQAASASASSSIPPIELYLCLIVMIETPDMCWRSIALRQEKLPLFSHL
jgi:hypothetical protein